MRQIFLALNHFSLKSLLQEYLALICGQTISEQIPIYRLSGLNSVVYRCLVKDSIQKLNLECEQPINSVVLNFKVSFPVEACMDFCLCDRSLAVWLKHLSKILSFPESVENNLPGEIVYPFFNLQYAHSRCCSILEGASELGLIVKNRDFSQTPRYTASDLHFNSSQYIFSLNNTQERNLINQIIAVIDALAEKAKQNWLILTKKLASSFLQFYDAYPVLALKAKNLELRDAYLSLVTITKSLLECLLVNKLGIPALREL